MHQVTYIERPGLLGLGQDNRMPVGLKGTPIPDPTNQAVLDALQAQVTHLQRESQSLNVKLDQILGLLQQGGGRSGFVG